jgi:hypothetical protein
MSDKEPLPTPDEFFEMLGDNADDTIDWLVSKIEEDDDE